MYMGQKVLTFFSNSVLSSDVPAFKFAFLQVTLRFLIEVNEYLVIHIPTQILLTILLSINHSSRCKFKGLHIP